MRSLRFTLGTGLLFIFVFFERGALAQDEVCIRRYNTSPDAKALGFAPSEVETLVAQEADAIGLSPQGIKVIPCEGVNKVRSNYIVENDIMGDYILYDPVWVREILGPDIKEATSKEAWDQAAFLFGHELGHVFGRHFTSQQRLPRIKKETEADGFAGCAAGALGASWSNVRAFISRIRSETETSYPSRTESLAVAKRQFDRCRARTSNGTQTAANSELKLTSDALKQSVRWYAEKPITDPNADDPNNLSQHSLWLDLDQELLANIVSATWLIHDTHLHSTVFRKDSEHLEYPFMAFGCWDLATVRVQLANGRPVIADFNECKSKPVSTRPGG